MVVAWKSPRAAEARALDVMSLLQTLSGVKQKSSHHLRHRGTQLAKLPRGEERQEEEQEVMFPGPHPNCSNICRDSIIFTGLMGRNVRDTRTLPARLSRV
jgi:hypothetical protein